MGFLDDVRGVINTITRPVMGPTTEELNDPARPPSGFGLRIDDVIDATGIRPAVNQAAQALAPTPSEAMGAAVAPVAAAAASPPPADPAAGLTPEMMAKLTAIPAQAAAPAAKSGSSKPKGPDGLDVAIDAQQRSGQAAIDELAATQLEGAEAVKRAEADKGVERQAQAVQLADKQAEVAKHNAELDAIDAANLKKAKDATIPDFWESRPGKLVGSTIGVALAGIGAGLLGSTNNQALTVVQHNIDSYFAREKEKIDNLFKVASEQGKINDKTRASYTQQLLDLKDQHSYVMEAAADKVKSVAAYSKGAADAAQTKMLATQLGEAAFKDKLEVRKLRSDEMLKSAQAAAARASAAESRADAALKKAQAANPMLGKTPSGEALKSQGFADTATAANKILLAKPLSAEGAMAIRDALANEAIYETKFMGAGPATKAAMMKLGQYESAEQKLKGTDKEAYLAIKQFINADLRRESGAAIGVSEFDSALGRYFRSVGDTPDILRQKDANRAQSIHGMRVAGMQEASGPPADPASAFQSQVAAAAAAGNPWALQFMNGGK